MIPILVVIVRDFKISAPNSIIVFLEATVIKMLRNKIDWHPTHVIKPYVILWMEKILHHSNTLLMFSSFEFQSNFTGSLRHALILFKKKKWIIRKVSPTCQHIWGDFLSRMYWVRGDGSSSYLSNGSLSITIGSQSTQEKRTTGWATRGG